MDVSLNALAVSTGCHIVEEVGSAKCAHIGVVLGALVAGTPARVTVVGHLVLDCESTAGCLALPCCYVEEFVWGQALPGHHVED